MKNQCNIHRDPHDKDNPYFCLSKSTAQNRDLSFAARGMLAYILSMPDDWQINLDDLRQGCGRDAARNILNELIEAGYIVPGTQQRINGRFATATPHQCYESPRTELPSTVHQKPSTSERQPVTENPTEQSNKDKVIKDSPQPKPKPSNIAKKKLTKQQRLIGVVAVHAFQVPVEEIHNSKEWDNLTSEQNVASRSAKIGTDYKRAFSMFKIDNPNEPETLWDFAKWYKSINGTDCVIPHKLEKIKHWVERWAKHIKQEQPGDLSAYEQPEDWEIDYASYSPAAAAS